MVELVACLAAVESDHNAFRWVTVPKVKSGIKRLVAVGGSVLCRYCLVAAQCLHLLHGHPEADRVRVPFLRLAGSLAGEGGQGVRVFY